MKCTLAVPCTLVALPRGCLQGLPALTPSERERLIMDLDGFRFDTIAPSFKEYVDAVLRPSFDAHLGRESACARVGRRRRSS